MIRLFNVYYPIRTLVLLLGEALIVGLSFVLGTLWAVESTLRLNNALFIEGGYVRILGLTGVVLLLSHGFDLYDSSQLGERLEQSFKLLFVLGLVALVLGGVMYISPEFLPGKNSAFAGVVILAVALFGWRSTYSWLVRQSFFRERVYVLGTGERAERVVNGLCKKELGIEVVGWTGNVVGDLTRESVASHLLGSVHDRGVHRVIVAMSDRRGTLPVEELLALRLAGITVEEATSWLEKISGRIEVEQLYPSWLIFAEGFRFSMFNRIMRRALNFSAAFIGLVFSLPLIPFIALAIKISSPGPVFYHQKRVGRGGANFYCYKFRTMRQDAEADTGATWATDNDPRITRVGKFLRTSRLDEIPQLWCVLKGDMHFVGPRPERPEFVEWLSKEIPYYGVRHVVRPGVTGWAQVQYKYGNTLEDAREKLQYDLFYIKNASVGLDLLIMFQTVKIVVLGRGAR
ncbi:MAG TPA: TIGR03013 family XrtA/PEP-CTERM system glycosyltransferase [Candidatus Sulfotelmatobacter sp.]|nr:TIGR03013 family XrtA/PEP-CTERM system glycosyltransferase [Candidatus Sulfotelmatobacter sp.]